MNDKRWNKAIKVENSLEGIPVEVERPPGEIGNELIYIRNRTCALAEVASKLRKHLIPVLHPRDDTTAEDSTREKNNTPLGRALGEVSEDLDDLYVFLTKIIDDLEL